MRFLQLFSRIRFGSLERNDIVILYSADYWIRRLILNGIKSTTLALYPECIYLTPAIFFRIFLRLKHINISSTQSKNRIKHLGRQLYAQYILACIDEVGAKVVLTHVDNSSFFQYLSRLDEKRTYFAIQNGTRTLFCVRDSLPKPPHPFARISMTNFFCFGQRDVDLFSRHGHAIEHYFPVGSLIGGYFQSVVASKASAPKFDLCLISQWHEHFFGKIVDDGFDEEISRRINAGISTMNLFLSRFVDETGLKLLICPRDPDRAELAFFKSAYGDRATIAKPDRENFSTYRAIKQSRLVVALNSTTLAEVFAWGQKVLWCNIPNDEHYEMLEAGISYFHGNDYSAFKQRVLVILEMPQAEYARETQQAARYINNFDPAHPPQEIIRSAVVKALGVADADERDPHDNKRHAGKLKGGNRLAEQQVRQQQNQHE